jgi:hypothetical protein
MTICAIKGLDEAGRNELKIHDYLNDIIVNYRRDFRKHFIQLVLVMTIDFDYRLTKSIFASVLKG